MSFGSSYAEIYDALYHDKDYGREAVFVTSVLSRHEVAPVRRLLDLGCGTGRHDVALAERGYRVHGVDASAAMLAQAKARWATLSSATRERLTFEAGDIRSVEIRQKYDAVVSLFHVMSYQTTDSDLLAAFAVARNSLLPGGLFLFDFWHGPAIAAEGPVRREKRIETDRVSAVRRTIPIWEKARDSVRVVYELEITDKSSGRTQVMEEEHLVRYLFCARLAGLSAQAGFSIVEWGEWLVGPPPRDDAFNVYGVWRAQ